MMHTRSRSLRRDPDFVKLWAGQTISIFGSGVTATALPLTAVLVLGASASQMGWLVAAESAPVLLMGVVAGVWVDRVRRRPVLVGADLGRAGLLACIPILAALGSLHIEHLLLVAATTGALTVLFDIAFRSYVPDLVGRDGILEANSRLATVAAVAEITTPGLTGALVQVIAAPLAVLLDAVSFLGSAVCVLQIRQPEAPPHSVSSANAEAGNQIAEGLRAVLGSPTLRALAGWEQPDVTRTGGLGGAEKLLRYVHWRGLRAVRPARARPQPRVARDHGRSRRRQQPARDIARRPSDTPLRGRTDDGDCR
jgi:MFS family permease